MNSLASPALFTPSWHAELELAYARFGDCTRPTLRRHLGPLRVQKHLEKTEMNYQSYQRLMKTENCKIATLGKIAKALEVSVTDILKDAKKE